MQSPPSSVLFELNGFSVHYYGVIMFFAIVSGLIAIRYAAKKFYKEVNTDIILDILPPIILFSLLGARLYYVLMDFDYYAKHVNQIFAVWQGGMSIHGGIIGGVLTGIILAKIKKISFFKYADVFAYGLLIGQAVGRFGNYFNCEAFGKPCSLPVIRLFIPEAYRPSEYVQYSYFHPTFLYESLWNVLVFFILLFGVRKFVQAKNLSDGTIFFSYLILYSVGRFFIEFCRIDSVRNILGFHVAQVVSLLIIIFGVVCLCVLNIKKKGKN